MLIYTSVLLFVEEPVSLGDMDLTARPGPAPRFPRRRTLNVFHCIILDNNFVSPVMTPGDTQLGALRYVETSLLYPTLRTPTLHHSATLNPFSAAGSEAAMRFTAGDCRQHGT